MVDPLAFIAAMPVGAKTTYFFLVVSHRYLRKVDLPVPALPVRKIDCRVRVIKSSAFLNSALFISIVGFKVGSFFINYRTRRIMNILY